MASKKLKRFDSSPLYTKFIKERDKALEGVLKKYHYANADTMRWLISSVHDVVRSYHAGGVIQPGTQVNGVKHAMRLKLEFFFKLASKSSFNLVKRMRRTVYTLSHVGEAEAIGRAWGKPGVYKADEQKLTQVHNKDSVYGGGLEARIDLYYNRLLNRVIEALEASFLVGPESLEEVQSRVDRAFPTVKRKPKIRKVKEADIKAQTRIKQDKKEFALGFVDDETWNDLVDDVLSDNFPPDEIRRASKEMDRVTYKDEEMYSWEMERELNDDFIQMVRDGQDDAIKESGIVDAMWIAVLDKTTCEECCEWRDGLLLSDIEAKLSKKGDDCDDSPSPPAHPNCRCQIVPVDKDLVEDIRSTQIQSKDFEEWLKS